MCGTNKMYTANTGRIIVNTANSNLDGTGTITPLITGAGNGTEIGSITVKSQQANAQGMVRIFLWNGAYCLLQEIMVPANVPTTTNLCLFKDGFATMSKVDMSY